MAVHQRLLLQQKVDAEQQLQSDTTAVRRKKVLGGGKASARSRRKQATTSHGKGGASVLFKAEQGSCGGEEHKNGVVVGLEGMQGGTTGEEAVGAEGRAGIVQRRPSAGEVPKQAGSRKSGQRRRGAGGAGGHEGNPEGGEPSSLGATLRHLLAAQGVSHDVETL
jgi:hypothetical protein